MAFEKVSKADVSGSPKISLRKSNSIGINPAAFEEFFDESHEYCEVFFDEEGNQLGLKPMEEEASESFSIVKSNSGATIAPTAFLKSKNLVPEVTTQYEPNLQKINGDTELVVIELDYPVGTYGSPDTDPEEDKEGDEE